MTDSASLLELASVLEAAGQGGAEVARGRQRHVDRSAGLVNQLGQAWTSPVSADIEQQLRSYYERATELQRPFSQGFSTFIALAADARRLGAELAAAEQNELSWLQRVQTLGRAVTTAAQDMISEQDIAAHERARNEYSTAMGRHETAKTTITDLRRQWRERAESARQALAAAVRQIDQVDLDPPDTVDDRFVREGLGQSEIHHLWSLHAAAHIDGLGVADRVAVWESLDAAERAALIEQLPGWVAARYGDHLTERERELLREAVRTAVSVTTQTISAGYGVRISYKELFDVRTGVSLRLTQETTIMTDGSVEVQFETGQLQRAGLGALGVLSATRATEAAGWVVLRFDSTEDYEEFLERWGAAGTDPRELVRLLDGFASEYVQGVGASFGVEDRLALDVPYVVQAAASVGATAYRDTARGETGLRFHAQLTASGGSVSPSGAVAASVAATIFTTPDGRSFIRLEGDASMVHGVGPHNGPVHASWSQGSRGTASVMLEIREENQARVTALVQGLGNADGGAVRAALDNLYDASHITISQYRLTEFQAGGTESLAPISVYAGVNTTTQDTVHHIEKRPFDVPYIHEF